MANSVVDIVGPTKTRLAPCGTVTAYNRHLREARRMNRTVTCTKCLEANAAASKRVRAAMDPEVRKERQRKWDQTRALKTKATKPDLPVPTGTRTPAPCGTRAAYVRHAREAAKARAGGDVSARVTCEECLAENRRVTAERKKAA